MSNYLTDITIDCFPEAENINNSSLHDHKLVLYTSDLFLPFPHCAINGYILTSLTMKFRLPLTE